MAGPPSGPGGGVRAGSSGAHQERDVDQGDRRRPRGTGSRAPAGDRQAASTDDQREADRQPPVRAVAPSRPAHEVRPRARRSARGRSSGRPSRCGRPRTPVAASSSRSGSTLRRCAPTPSSAPPTGHHHGGRRRTPARATKTGSAAERHGVRQPRPGRRLQPEVVGPARRDADEVHEPRRRAPQASESGQRGEAATAGTRRGPAPRRPPRWRAACRCARCGGPARGRARSLDQPMESWPVSTAATTRATVPGGRSGATASSPARAVTARVGPAWARRAGSRPGEGGAPRHEACRHVLPRPSRPAPVTGPALGHSSHGTHPARVTPGAAARRPPGRAR